MNTIKLLFSIVFVAASLSVSHAQRGARIGYIDMEYILENVPEYQEAKNQLGSKVSKWKRDLDKMRQEIEQLKLNLSNERILLTKELIEEQEEEIKILEDEMIAYQQNRFGPGGDLDVQRRQLVQPIQDQVFNLVQELAEEKKRLGGVAPADEAPAVDSQPSSGFISIEDAKNITKKSPQVSGPYGGSVETFNTTIINNPKFRNYIPDPSAKNPFGLSDEEMDQLTVGQRKDLEGREKSLINMNVNRIVTQQIKGLRDDLRNIDDAQITREEQVNLEKLGKAAGIDPNPNGRFLPGDFIDNKNLKRTKDFFKENPGEFKKFVDDPRGYLSGALSEDNPNQFEFVAQPTGDQNLDAQVKESGIPPIPDPKTDPEGFNTHITQYAQKYQELGADPKIVSRAQSYVQKHNVTDPQSFQAAPIVDRDLNVSKALVSIAIAENARLAGGSFEESFKENYNLFDVDKRQLSHQQMANVNAFDRLNGFAGDEFKSYSHYFLEYGPDSFTKFHTDATTYVHQTMITVLDDRELVGGESLVMLPYDKRARPSNKYAKRGEGNEAPLGQVIIPKVVKLNRGQTLIYDKDLMHGVGQVQSGRRLVLVSWYDKAD